MIINALVSAVIENTKWFLIYSGIGTIIEMILSGERQSFISRLRGFFFNFVFILTGATVGLFFQLQIQALNIRPILAIDLTSTPNSRDPIVQFAGLTIFPLLAAFVFDFFYYWMHRLQHALPLLWREHSVHHSIRELN